MAGSSGASAELRGFWTFQLIEGGWLLALGVVLLPATAWVVRDRAG